MHLLFIHDYAKYYKIQLTNKFTALCDNRAYVNKLQESMEYPYQFRNPYKKNEPEALTTILQCLPTQYTIQYDFGHQVDKTERKYLSNYAKLNIDVDHITTNSVTIPINTHVSSILFAVYVKKYIYITKWITT